MPFSHKGGSPSSAMVFMTRLGWLRGFSFLSFERFWLIRLFDIEYISGGQLSPYEIAFRIELGLNPHSKIVSEPILDPFKGPPTMLSMHQAQKCWA